MSPEEFNTPPPILEQSGYEAISFSDMWPYALLAIAAVTAFGYGTRKILKNHKKGRGVSNSDWRFGNGENKKPTKPPFGKAPKGEPQGWPKGGPEKPFGSGVAGVKVT